jgi:hypothetical protein
MLQILNFILFPIKNLNFHFSFFSYYLFWNTLLAQGQTQGSTLQQRTNKTLTTGPFGNTCEADEVSPEVEAGVVARLRCLQP